MARKKADKPPTPRSSSSRSVEDLSQTEEPAERTNSIQFQSRVDTQSRVPMKKKAKTLSKKSGLVMPVLKVLKDLKRGKYAANVQKGENFYK